MYYVLQFLHYVPEIKYSVSKMTLKPDIQMEE